MDKENEAYMYPFQITPEGPGNTRLVLGNISIIADGYHIEQNQHYFDNPNTAIAYFIIKDEIYSLSNRWGLYTSAEEFYDAMKYQQDFFDRKRPDQYNNSKNTPGNLGAWPS
jgi:hypothetical protein